MNTAADVFSRLERTLKNNPEYQRKLLNNTIQVNVESLGIAQGEPVFIDFDTTDQHETIEKELWKRKGEARRDIPTESPVITVLSCFYANDLHKDTTIVNIAQLTKPSRVPIEQDSNRTLLDFKSQMLGLGFDEQSLINDERYMHYSRNKKKT